MCTLPFVLVNFLVTVPFDDTFDPASLFVLAEKLVDLLPFAAAVGVGLVGRPTLPLPPLTEYTLLSGATGFLGIVYASVCWAASLSVLL